MKRLFARISTRAWIIFAIIVGVLVLGAGGVYAYTQVIAPRLAQQAYGPARANGAPARQGSRTARKNKPAAGTGGGNGTGNQLLRLIASGIRGQATVADSSAPGGYVTVIWAKGRVTSVNAVTNQLSIQEADGTAASYTVPASARILVSAAAGNLANLQPGTMVYVVSKQISGGQPVVMAIAGQTGTPAATNGNGSGASPTSTPTPANS